MFFYMEVVINSLKLLKKKSVSFCIFVIYFLVIHLIFNRNIFFDLLAAELRSHIDRTISLGIWRSSLLELVAFILISLITFILATYSIEFKFSHVFSKLRKMKLKKLVNIIGFYLLFNFIAFFITGLVSEFRFNVIVPYIQDFLNLGLVIFLSNIIYSGFDNYTFRFRILKPYFACIATVICSLSIIYIGIHNRIYSKVYIESLLENGNLFSALDISSKLQIPQWYEFIAILIFASIYTFLITFSNTIFIIGSEDKQVNQLENI